MKVARWYSNSDIRIEEVPLPRPSSKEMLVQVKTCGICGSDVVEWYRLPRAPLVQGHEIGAIIVDVGSEVKKFRSEDRVCIPPKIPCRKCYYCQHNHHPQCSEIKERLPGGFAQFLVVPESFIENDVILLSKNVTFDQSTFIEPLACVSRAQDIASLQKDQTILILGCGMSGLLHVKLAKHKKAKVVATDLNTNRLGRAFRYGADVIINASDDVPARLVQKTGRLADVVMICTGAPAAIEQAWQCVDKGGAIVFFAVPDKKNDPITPTNMFWTKETRILFSYYCSPNDMSIAYRLISTGEIIVDDLITHRLRLDEIQKGFQMVLKGDKSIKVIIYPNDA